MKVESQKSTANFISRTKLFLRREAWRWIWLLAAIMAAKASLAQQSRLQDIPIHLLTEIRHQ